MLKKKNRANTKTVEEIFKQGKFLNCTSLTFKFVLNKNSKEPAVSFIAPKSIAKLAVKRNMLRRRGYRALEKYIHQFPAGLVGAFIFRKAENDTAILENEIKNILDKIS